MRRPGRVFVRQFKQAAVKLVKVGGQEFVVVDDGITIYNSPAFQVFLIATVTLYKDGGAWWYRSAPAPAHRPMLTGSQ